MTTVVNNPAPVQDNGGSGLLVGILTIVAFIALFFYFGVPAIRRMGGDSINVDVQTPRVVVPDKVDVDVTTDN